jgi:hypothetical protein
MKPRGVGVSVKERQIRSRLPRFQRLAFAVIVFGSIIACPLPSSFHPCYVLDMLMWAVHGGTDA